MSIVKILVIEVTNLELRSFEFGTPLRHAVFDREHEIFELLISFGANVNSLTPDKDSLSFISVTRMMKSLILPKFSCKMVHCLLSKTSDIKHQLK